MKGGRRCRPRQVTHEKRLDFRSPRPTQPPARQRVDPGLTIKGAFGAHVRHLQAPIPDHKYRSRPDWPTKARFRDTAEQTAPLPGALDFASWHNGNAPASDNTVRFVQTPNARHRRHYVMLARDSRHSQTVAMDRSMARLHGPTNRNGGQVENPPLRDWPTGWTSLEAVNWRQPK